MHEVPVEDLQEQSLSPVPDVRLGREHPDDRPPTVYGVSLHS